MSSVKGVSRKGERRSRIPSLLFCVCPYVSKAPLVLFPLRQRAPAPRQQGPAVKVVLNSYSVARPQGGTYHGSRAQATAGRSSGSTKSRVMRLCWKTV